MDEKITDLDKETAESFCSILESQTKAFLFLNFNKSLKSGMPPILT